MSVAEAVALTDVGRRREHNEDSVIAQDPLYAVADGVGGAAAGETASRMALDLLAARVGTIVATGDPTQACRALEDAIAECNLAIFDRQHGDEERSGMATTLTAAITLDGGTLVVGHVGDSRAYRIGGGGIEQVTDDHSIVGELVRAGQLSPQAAAEHPQRNVITRAVGAEPHVDIDTSIVTLAPGEWLLLCSDGLTGHVEDAELEHAVRNGPTAADAARHLVDQANRRGGTDNISIVLVQPLAGDDATAAARTEGGAADTGTGGAGIDADASATMTTGARLAAPVGPAGRPGEISDEIDITPIVAIAGPGRAATSGADGAGAEGSGNDVSAPTSDGDGSGAGSGSSGGAGAPTVGVASETVAAAAGPAVAALRPPPQTTGTARALSADEGGSGWRRWRGYVVALVVLLLAFTVGVVAWKQAYFLAADDTGYVAIYQGFAPAGLHQLVETTDLLRADLDDEGRRTVDAHKLRSEADARRLAEQLPDHARPCVPGARSDDGLHTCVKAKPGR